MHESLYPTLGNVNQNKIKHDFTMTHTEFDFSGGGGGRLFINTGCAQSD